MRDIPVFQTEYGTAGLVLNQVPYTGTAYVYVTDVTEWDALISECVQFCTACGAEHIYLHGDPSFVVDAPCVRIIEMVSIRESLEDTDACLMPVTDATISQWLSIYRTKMKNVDHAAYVSDRDGRCVAAEGGAYFAHRDGQLLGIGKAREDTIACLASVRPGAGRDVVLALCHALSSEIVRIEVASTNEKAISLYESLGFIRRAVLHSWYKIK